MRTEQNGPEVGDLPSIFIHRWTPEFSVDIKENNLKMFQD